MWISGMFKRSCVAFTLLMLLACSGGGGGSTPPTAATPNIYLAQSSHDFSGIVLDNSADKTFEIKNTGNANLKIGQILLPNLSFSISGDTCSNATLAPSQTCSLKVRFSPTSQGPSSATLSIHSNDPVSSTVSISLTGEGYGLNVWINKVNSDSCPSISADVTVKYGATTVRGGADITIRRDGGVDSDFSAGMKRDLKTEVGGSGEVEFEASTKRGCSLSGKVEQSLQPAEQSVKETGANDHTEEAGLGKPAEALTSRELWSGKYELK